jgi:hypothetical protein
MALQSKLFKQDAKLQACLLHDAAHVTPGARGDYVGKIQIALNALGDEVIDASEIKANHPAHDRRLHPTLRSGTRNDPETDRLEVRGGTRIPPITTLTGDTIGRIQKLWPKP